MTSSTFSRPRGYGRITQTQLDRTTRSATPNKKTIRKWLTQSYCNIEGLRQEYTLTGDIDLQVFFYAIVGCNDHRLAHKNTNSQTNSSIPSDWSRSCRVIKQHPSLLWNVMIHGFLQSHPLPISPLLQTPEFYKTAKSRMRRRTDFWSNF